MVTEVSTEYVREVLDNGADSVICVLSKESYDDEHIPGSINIPESDIDSVADRYDKDDEIIVYCHDEDCGASPRSAERLEELGFTDVKDYEGGVEGWRDAGFELASA